MGRTEPPTHLRHVGTSWRIVESGLLGLARVFHDNPEHVRIIENVIVSDRPSPARQSIDRREQQIGVMTYTSLNSTTYPGKFRELQPPSSIYDEICT
jgi:hypothetical protein